MGHETKLAPVRDLTALDITMLFHSKTRGKFSFSHGRWLMASC